MRAAATIRGGYGYGQPILVGSGRATRFFDRMHRCAKNPGLLVMGLMLLLGAALPAPAAVNRVFQLSAPAEVAPGAKVEAQVWMTTDAGEGETIAFLQAEYSTDAGKTWTSAWAEQDLGTTADRRFSFTAGAAGTQCRVRARVAYRGGVAGAVDCSGAAIRWYDTWKEWHEPPAKWAVTTVR